MWRLIYIFLWIVGVHGSIASPTNDRTDTIQREQDKSKSSKNICEYCEKVSCTKYLIQSRLSEFQLCYACDEFERRHGELIPINERFNYNKFKSSPNICQYCNKVSCGNYLIQSKLSEFKLCHACYQWEKRHGELITVSERLSYKKLKSSSNICQYCDQVNSYKYLFQSQLSEFKLCRACYQSERKHGELIPVSERQNYKFKLSSNICEYCDKFSCTNSLTQSQLYKFKLCNACYKYERKHGELIPVSERYHNKFKLSSNNLLSKDDIQKESAENEIESNRKRNRDDFKKENQTNDFNNDTVITNKADILYNLAEELRKDYVKTIDNSDYDSNLLDTNPNDENRLFHIEYHNEEDENKITQNLNTYYIFSIK